MWFLPDLPKGRHGSRLLGCCAAKLAVSFAIAEAFPIIPLEAERLEIPRYFAMTVLAAQPLAYIFTSPIVGRLLDGPDSEAYSPRALNLGLATVAIGALFLGGNPTANTQTQSRPLI